MTQPAPMPPHAEIVQDMKSLLSEIAKALVDDPDSMTVEAILEQDSTLLRLRVSQKDVGKIIGKQGRTARSLRTILGAASMKLHHRFSLDILEVGEAPGLPQEHSSLSLVTISELSSAALVGIVSAIIRSREETP